MNNQIKDLKLQTFGGKESEVDFSCEKSRLAVGARGLMKGERLELDHLCTSLCKSHRVSAFIYLKHLIEVISAVVNLSFR